MITKYLIGASIFTIISASLAQAADGMISQKSEQIVSPSISSSTFSWEGFYLGGQINSFSSKLSATARDNDVPLLPYEDTQAIKWVPVEKKYLPKLSGFVAGVFAGANIDLGQGFILGVDTDVLLSERKGTKIFVTSVASVMGNNEPDPSGVKNDNDKDEKLNDIAKSIIKNSLIGENSRGSRSIVRSPKKVEEDHITFDHTFKQKWTGATRMRIGYPFGYIMPYISGGVTYGGFQDILSVSIAGAESSNTKSNDTKTVIGYTLGGGIDLAITDNVIARAEYRYSDFGKKKFGNTIELDYKVNDFRVGVAYKF
ncbi:outer membrane protein [Bartonella sp. CB175]|uniref:outer membrane protein n=1 Tax=Bartonella sp. CB175 TaxID=3112256 RepID=UPI00300DDAF3